MMMFILVISEAKKHPHLNQTICDYSMEEQLRANVIVGAIAGMIFTLKTFQL